ncbi:MAG TPA: ROK family protein [Chloroflexota bacterium]|nr:ROK family protein [Chloroflexota bacterium]
MDTKSRSVADAAAAAPPRLMPGAVGVHIGGTACRAAASLESDIWRGVLSPGSVADVCQAIQAAVREVEPDPKFVVVATPGHINASSGTVSGAANLGPQWEGIVPLRDLLVERLQCEVEIRNDTEAALQAERRRGALIAVNDGALITLSTGVGVALLVNGRGQSTELGHSVLQFEGPPCIGRPHRGCYESFLGGWALPLRYRERHPDFNGTSAREIPDDPEFWTECGARLGELVVMLCLLGQGLEAVSLNGAVALARAHFLLPALRARVKEEASLLGTVPRLIRTTPLGDDVTVLGALLVARDMLYPFRFS